jgi:excisionase family DNA binding protein
MDHNLLATMIPMVLFKKEVFEYVEKVAKDLMAKRVEKQLLTIEDAAEVLNVKVSKLRQAIFRQEIGHVKLGALIRFRQEDINNYIKSNVKNTR